MFAIVKVYGNSAKKSVLKRDISEECFKSTFIRVDGKHNVIKGEEKKNIVNNLR